MTGTASTPGLVALSALGREDAAVMGAKAATLGELARAGFPVPEGVVVPPGALGDGTLTEALAAALANLGGGPVAIRSSGVAEDLADASFAGLYDTVLDVTGPDAVHAAVCRVALSAGAERAAGYRRRHGVDDASPIAVLVQRQVAADVAGVALTANPVTGRRDEVLVSAVRGLGDALVGGRTDAEDWTIREAETARRSSTDVLTERQARAVAALALRVQAHLGCPQDVEWALADGRLVLLQARPMTALPDEVSWDPPEAGGWARNFRLGEWLSDPVTPLFESWLLTRLEQVQFERYRQMAGARPPEPTHVVVNGWYFYSMNWLPSAPVDLLRALRGWLPRMATRPRQAVMMFPALARFGVGRALAEWRTALLPAYRRAVHAAEETVEQADPRTLVALVDDLATHAGEQFTSMTLVAGYGWKAETALARFHESHLAGRVGFGHQRLLRGLGTPAPVHPVVTTLDWIEPALQRPAQERTERLDTVAADRRAAEEEARAALAGRPLLVRRFARLLDSAQRFACIREEQVDAFTAAWPVMRAAVVRLGEHLAGSGQLRRGDDIFFLTRGELDGVLRGEAPPADTPDLRRRSWEERRRLVPPLVLGEFGAMANAREKAMFGSVQPAWRPAPPVEAATTGVAASPGRATGPVRVVRGPADFDRFSPGDVLVARAMTPAYIPLFARAAAVVTDVGSVTAHASLVVREYGIPCVVGCGDATASLRDGQLVTVDGTGGYVVTA